MRELNATNKDLCVDVLLELFKYLYIDELFISFNDVLRNLPLLLKQANIPLYVRFVDTYFRKHILPNIEINNVKSIRIPNMYQMAPVNLYQFNQVQLLTLHNVTDRNWPKCFPKHVKYLIIHVRSKYRHEVFRKALSVDYIQILEFHSTFLHFDDCDDKLAKPSSIKHLILNSKQCFIDYQFLINNMPNLLSLRSVNTHYPHRCKLNGNIFRNLRTINLTCKHIDIGQMIDFLTHVASRSLRRCRLINIENGLSNSTVDSQLWRHWLEYDAFQLKQLEIKFLQSFYDTKQMIIAEARFQKDPFFQKYHFHFKCINEYQAMIHGTFTR